MASKQKNLKLIWPILLFCSIVILILVPGPNSTVRDSLSDVKINRIPKENKKKPHHPIPKPTPTFFPPHVKDPFPSLATSTPPPIPAHNVPEKDGWKNYGLPAAPPLLIGFTRTWPMLLQSVVSYITAGWPPEQIYVVENTGVQQANARGQLTLQHPWYLNHTTLGRLGVNVVQTPTLLTFAQLQNFYFSLSYAHDWPYYFWSHMDVLALGYENGFENLTARAGEPGYKSFYTLCLEELNRTLVTDERWGLRFFAYDQLTLQNPRALEDVGGWDPMITYYYTDCDLYTRLDMRGWTHLDANVGIVTDTSTVLHDLLALYRDPDVQPRFIDPNPPPTGTDIPKNGAVATGDLADPIEYWKALERSSDAMYRYNWENERGRNTWQGSQHGGQGEPFYYDAVGWGEAFDVIDKAGQEVYQRKWGHKDCFLVPAGLRFEDQWRVQKDFER